MRKFRSEFELPQVHEDDGDAEEGAVDGEDGESHAG